jgi:hypothetical protein
MVEKMSEENESKGKKFIGKVRITEKGGYAVDLSGMKDFVSPEEIAEVEEETLEKVRMERDDLKAKLEMVADVEFNKAKQRLGAPDFIETPEQLEKWQKEQNKNPEVTTGGGASGKTPLSEPSSSGVKEYETYEEMYADVVERTKHSDPKVRAEAQAIQKQLFEKLIQKKQRSYVFEKEADLGTNELWEKRLNARLKSENPEIRKQAQEALEAEMKRLKPKPKNEGE